jgi:GTP-binding protein
MSTKQNSIKQFLHEATFVLSAAQLKQLPVDQGIEVAFAGRSNAGKSSVLNTLCQQKNLARTSNTPGRTQQINVFKLNETCRLMDLPGYGFAKVPLSVKQQWEVVLDHYFQTRQSLTGIVIVMDIRHPLKPFDQVMIDWAYAAEKKVHILLNKADKLTRQAALKTLQSVQASISTYDDGVTAQVFSTIARTGLDECNTLLEQWFSTQFTAQVIEE